MQVDEEGIEICSSLPSFVTMVLDKNNSKNKKIEVTPFH
jgi:hypothetical protein